MYSKRSMGINSGFKKVLSYWGVAVLIAIVWYYSASNREDFQLFLFNLWNGNEIEIEGNRYKINTDVASIRNEHESVYFLDTKNVDSEIVFLQSASYSIPKMIEKGAIESVPIFKNESCIVFLFQDPAKIGMKSVVRYSSFPAEVLFDGTESIETLKNVYCRLFD